MARIVSDWRIDLIEAHADLFHPLPDNPGVAQASPECGAGWLDLLERACARIRAAVQADGGTFKFTQIKEKYGTARLYWEGALRKRTGGSRKSSTWPRPAAPAHARSAARKAACTALAAG
jgi:hypothetical protein